MDMKKNAFLFTCMLFLSCGRLFSQDLNQAGTFLISTNPLKLIYGIINVELEYYITPSVSVEMGTEYVLAHYVIKQEVHPDFVCRIGPRYHAFNNKAYGNKNDLYFGAFVGYCWSKDFEEQKFFNYGPEIGYKYKFNSPLFINSKIFVTSPFIKPRIIPGLECMLGYALN
jgi:hypothetical protein